ncbi:hypothetical protein G7Y89_g9245 [Cudoniella acicularis]|uniref:Uncharacterized protein n=1 Tax=Cudoniella acicularis TaxID=354080 RepID=A0A8H4VZT6_9HELO|nr:hypothetical protein G7Y89_g9245 [Cudoniella acicularis]
MFHNASVSLVRSFTNSSQRPMVTITEVTSDPSTSSRARLDDLEAPPDYDEVCTSISRVATSERTQTSSNQGPELSSPLRRMWGNLTGQRRRSFMEGPIIQEPLQHSEVVYRDELAEVPRPPSRHNDRIIVEVIETTRPPTPAPSDFQLMVAHPMRKRRPVLVRGSPFFPALLRRFSSELKKDSVA